MRKPAVPLANPGDADATEAAFYEALCQGDIDRLMQCWADDDEVVCVHPGGARLLGPAAIRSVFDAMLANGTLHIEPLKVHKLQTLSASVHSVLERLEVPTDEGPRHAYVLATNVYHLTTKGWRLVAHHASPATSQTAQDVSKSQFVLH